MPEQVRCPECNAALRVPDSLLGKNVKCPKCQTTFVAEIEEPVEPEGIVREPAPSSRRSRVPDETEDEELPPEEEDEDRPRRRRRRRRGGTAAAESAVAGPAIAMMVVAGLDIALAILDLLLRLLGIGIYAAGAAQARAGARGPGADLLTSGVTGITSDIFGVALAVLILVGAIKMKGLSSYGLAMTACIVSMLPCHACCCLGLPFGIWGLVMLNKPEVKDAFPS
jgi:predicted Zn finger-like uncharacterized protein